MTASKVIPILRIFDVAKAKEFYIDFLGFISDWEHRFDDNAPLYTQVSKNGIVLHLSEHHGDCCPGSAVFVWVTGIDAYQQQLSAKKYNYLRPGVEETPWGTRMMDVVDPFGNHIRFNENIKQP